MKKLLIVALLSFSTTYSTKCSSHAATCEYNYRNGLYSYTDVTKSFPTNKEAFEQAINDVTTNIQLKNAIATKLRKRHSTLFITPTLPLKNDITYQDIYWNTLRKKESLDEELSFLIRSMNQRNGKNKRKFEE